jgi:hypothetical protein
MALGNVGSRIPFRLPANRFPVTIDCNRAADRVGPSGKPFWPPPVESCRSGLPGQRRTRWRRGTVAAGNLHAESVAHHSPGSPRRRTLGDRMEIVGTLKGCHNRYAEDDAPPDDG